MAFNEFDINKLIFVPSVDMTSLAVGINALNSETTGTGNVGVGYLALNAVTTGSNNLAVGPNAGSSLTTGSNNLIIATNNASGFPSTTTGNTFWLGAGSTAIMSATSINSTPAVTIPGTLSVTGGITSPLTGVGGTVGGVATGSYSQASNTVLSAVTGMQATLVAGAVYIIDAYLATTNNGTGGIKLSFGGANTTATATTFVADTWAYNTTTLTAEANITSLSGNLVNAAVAATAVFIGGSITVNAGGVVALYAAQNTSNGTALTIANGSYVQFTRIA